jgi:hypothetical protein
MSRERPCDYNGDGNSKETCREVKKRKGGWLLIPNAISMKLASNELRKVRRHYHN